MVTKYYDYDKRGYVPEVPLENVSNKDIAGLVADITKERKDKVEPIESALKTVNARIEALNDFKERKAADFNDESTIRANFAGALSEQDLNIFIENFKKITDEDLDTVIKAHEQAKKLLENLHKRFSKDDVCLGVVGRKRKGKSSFIKEITGVSDKVCPTSPRGEPCTGVCSIIRNRPDQDKTTAKFTYYTEDELKEIFEKYKEAYSRKGFTAVKNILFGENGSGFKALYDAIPAANDPLLYKSRILEYYDHYGRIMELVKKETEETDNEDVIQQRVAQTVGQKRYHDFLAVKKAEIYTKFAASDVKNITLIDTIGLGETALGVEEKAAETVAFESDFVIMVNPTYSITTLNGGQDREVLGAYNCIYRGKEVPVIENGTETANEYMKEGLQTLDPSLWSFAVFNPWSEDGVAAPTDEIINEHMNALKDEFGFFAGSVSADCREKDELKERVIVPALQYIYNNIEEIDDWFEKEVVKSVGTANTEWDKLVSAVTTATISDAEKTRKINALATAKANKVIGGFRDLLKNYITVPEGKYIKNLNHLVNNLEEHVYVAEEEKLPLMAIMKSYNSTRKNIEDAFATFKTDASKVCVDEKTNLFEKVKEITGLGEGIKCSADSDAFDKFKNAYLNQSDHRDIFRAFKNISEAGVNTGNILSAANAATSEFLDPQKGNGNIPLFWNSGIEDEGHGNIYANIKNTLIDQQIFKVKKQLEVKLMISSPEDQIYSAIRAFLTALFNADDNQWFLLYQNSAVASVVFANDLKDVKTAQIQIGTWNDTIALINATNDLGRIGLDFSKKSDSNINNLQGDIFNGSNNGTAK